MREVFEVGDRVRVAIAFGKYREGWLLDIGEGFARVRLDGVGEAHVEPRKLRRAKPSARAPRPLARPTPLAEPRARVLEGSPRPSPKPASPARSAAHLERVRALPCCVCGRPGPSHAHHHGPRGVGQKTSDYRTVPLCAMHHDEWHATHRAGSLDRVEAELRFALSMLDLLVPLVEGGES